MSLILDALRKSEAERRRGQAPDLHSPGPLVRPLPHQGGPAKIAFVILAVLLVAAVAWLVFAPGPAMAPDEAPATQVPAAVGGDPAPARATASSPAPAPPLPAPAAAHASPAPPPAGARATMPVPTPATIPAATAAAAPVIAPAPAHDAVPAAPVAAAPANEPAPPDIAFLPAEQRGAMAPLKMSMHVWSEQPAERFAIIDGQRVGEGARVPGGVVAEIRRDGVVLDVGGRLYLLHRP